MKNINLHELAKFGAGVVAADFLFLVWAAQMELLPLSFMGRTLTVDMLLPGLIFDAALFFILVHYGWCVGKIPALRERSYFLAAGIVFGVVSLAHMMRVFTGADLIIGEWTAPLWLSWLGVAVTLYLAYMSFHLAFKFRRRQ